MKVFRVSEDFFSKGLTMPANGGLLCPLQRGILQFGSLLA